MPLQIHRRPAIKSLANAAGNSNRLLIIGSSAGAVTGNANLTFSGTTLTVNGTVSATAVSATSVTIDGTALSASGAELNHVDGVTSGIQTQLNAKQAADADLTALSSCQSGGASALAALTSTEIGIIDGATVTTTELNQLDALARGNILFGNASAVTSRLAPGGVNEVLTSDGTDISWASASGGGTASDDSSLILHMQMFT